MRAGPGRPPARAGAAAVGQGGGRRRESCCRHAAGCQIALMLWGGVSLIPARAPSPWGGEPGPGRPGEEGSPGPAWLAEVGVGCSLTAPCVITAAGGTRRRAREPVCVLGREFSASCVPLLDTELVAWKSDYGVGVLFGRPWR